MQGVVTAVLATLRGEALDDDARRRPGAGPPSVTAAV